MINYKNKIFLFWLIGKKAYDKQCCYDNIVERLSDYYSYFFGNSILYTRENIRIMKIFYMNFPIYYRELEKISWEQYQLLFNIKNRKARLFYFYLSLFFKSSYNETLDFIYNEYYERI